jgi:hypothetical protein
MRTAPMKTRNLINPQARRWSGIQRLPDTIFILPDITLAAAIGSDDGDYLEDKA